MPKTAVAVAVDSQPEPETLASVAREYLHDAGGDTAAASARLIKRIEKDAEFRTSVVAEAIADAAEIAVGTAMRHHRSAVWNGIVPKAKTSVVALANGITNALLDFPLKGGVRLRDATREQVLEQSHLYRTSAADMSAKHRFLAAVAKRVAPGKTVGDSLTEEQVRAMHERAVK